jgi:hypothetical protein
MVFRTTSNTLTFRYIKDKHKDSIVARPRVEIRLSNRDKSFKFAMLVDSGADISLIPLEVAEILELELKDKGESKSASGEFETFQSSVHAELLKGNKTYSLGKMDVRVPCNISKGPTLNTQALLGRFLFFRKFDITFRENICKIILRSPKKR